MGYYRANHQGSFQEFQNTRWKNHHSYGGALRSRRQGRGVRPLSSKDPLHLVFKVNRARVKYGLRTYRRYFLILQILERYSKKFFVQIEQYSIQGDHIHLLIRTKRRSQFTSFFRVVAGQIAQQFEQQGLLTPSVGAVGWDLAQEEGSPRVTDTLSGGGKGERSRGLMKMKKLWKHRPFTRVVRGWRALKICRNYIRLNEQEALKVIPYRKERLRGLSSAEWNLLWA
ncbi:MAG: hypothetical protein BroJett040_04840 [Oligoflexia bacterium]|nr:MAG: hypothetical protein BroJett040_04840 [Oligoflexia bacterium]